MAKAKAKKPAAVAPQSDLELKVERLEVLSMAQDLETFSVRLAALKTKLGQLQAEANLIQRDIQDLTPKGQELFQQYQQRLTALRARLGVPEDKDLNLRTGELVDKPEQSEAPQQ